MRRAQPDELQVRAVPAITARVTASELKRWLPIPFEDISDPLAVAEPSTGALVQLRAGSYVVVYHGKESQQLVVEIPEATEDASALISEFLQEVPLPASRVLWRRPDIE